jgi:hypothetical protein
MPLQSSKMTAKLYIMHQHRTRHAIGHQADDSHLGVDALWEHSKQTTQATPQATHHQLSHLILCRLMLGAPDAESAVASAGWLLQLQLATVLLDATVTAACTLLVQANKLK